MEKIMSQPHAALACWQRWSMPPAAVTARELKICNDMAAAAVVQ